VSESFKVFSAACRAPAHVRKNTFPADAPAIIPCFLDYKFDVADIFGTVRTFDRLDRLEHNFTGRFGYDILALIRHLLEQLVGELVPALVIPVLLTNHFKTWHAEYAHIL